MRERKETLSPSAVVIERGGRKGNRFISKVEGEKKENESGAFYFSLNIKKQQGRSHFTPLKRGEKGKRLSIYFSLQKEGGNARLLFFPSVRDLKKGKERIAISAVDRRRKGGGHQATVLLPNLSVI